MIGYFVKFWGNGSYEISEVQGDAQRFPNAADAAGVAAYVHGSIAEVGNGWIVRVAK